MNNKLLKNIGLGFSIIAFFALCVFLFKFFDMATFLKEVENKTFDLRQNIVAPYKDANKDIVILTIDDASYEYIIEKYGAWPAPRDFWADLTRGMEKTGPKALIYDLLFVQNFKAFGNSDKKLSDAVTSNKNIYVAMNFDNQPAEVREPVDLPEKLATNVKGNSDLLKNASAINFTNVRSILKPIMEGTDNIGFINITRDNDGVLRAYHPILVYKDNFYKHLTLLAGMELLGIDTKNVEIDKNNNIILSDGRKIPIDKNGKCYLNWYGGAETYKYIPVYKAAEALKKGDYKFLKEEFKDKVVFVGTTVTSLGDIKTVPLARRFPGVETHAVFLNNIIDNNFIQKTGVVFDTVVTLILIILTGLIVVRSKSVAKAGLSVLILVVLYALLSVYLMYFMNLWIGLVLPVAASIFTITAAYAVKYIITSRDYEHTYKLAVTDGLTEMYNHRYFQEEMKKAVDNTKRYETSFSLIMVDIDFFKKFNDKYGHQSGDAVLRQVAQTIKKNIRSTDIPCRYGGEEMAIILTNTKKSEAGVVAQKICEAVRQKEFELATGDYTHVTVSLGVAEMPNDGEDAQSIIEYADKCLYIAKGNGRNQVVSEAN